MPQCYIVRTLPVLFVLARRCGGTVLAHKVHQAAVSGTDLSWSPGTTWAG